jgi:hypothetical protein
MPEAWPSLTAASPNKIGKALGESRNAGVAEMIINSGLLDIAG